MQKKWVYGAVCAIVTVIVLAIILVSDSANGHSQFDRYKSYADKVGVVDWSISENTAEGFADANCDKLAQGQVPAIRFMNENHVKSSAAVIAAYCPKSFDNFLAGVITDDPEYRNTALYVNERLQIDSD